MLLFSRVYFRYSAVNFRHILTRNPQLIFIPLNKQIGQRGKRLCWNSSTQGDVQILNGTMFTKQIYIRLIVTRHTCSGATWQKFDIFSLTDISNGVWLLQTIRSGDKPNPRNCLTLCCVGFVFCSPVALGWSVQQF